MIVDELVGNRAGHLLSVGDIYIKDLEKSRLYQSRLEVLEDARRTANYSAFPGTQDDFFINYAERNREISADPVAFHAKYGHRLWIQTSGVTDVRNIREDAIQTYDTGHSFIISNHTNPELQLHASSLEPKWVLKATGNHTELIDAVTAHGMFWSVKNDQRKLVMASDLLEYYGDTDSPLYGVSWAVKAPGRRGPFYATFIGEEDLRNVVRQLRADPGILVETVNFHFPDIIEGLVSGGLQPPREFDESTDDGSDNFVIYSSQRYLAELSEGRRTEQIKQPQVRAPPRRKRWFIF